MHAGSAPEPSSPSAAAPWVVPRTERDVPVAFGELFAGRYIIEGILGEGGMGVVCLGRHVELDQPVAIKFLRQALTTNPAVVRRFLNEGRAAAALTNPHVVRVMDVGQLTSGQPYLVMERLEGIDLDALIEERGPLPADQAVGYTLEACEALEAAHAAGIIHRDIKPENLFLSRSSGGRGVLKVVDFGLAKRLGKAHGSFVTGPQDAMGSPCYMSPEQIVSARAVDTRTDIWALGVVLYRLLSGKLPFDGDSLAEVCKRVLNDPPRPLKEVCPSVPRELEKIVHRCMQKDPGLRYPTIRDLSQHLLIFRAGRNGDALRGMIDRRSRPRPRRLIPTMALVGSAAAIALAVTAGVRAKEDGILGNIVQHWLVPTLTADTDAPVRHSPDVHFDPAPLLDEPLAMRELDRRDDAEKSTAIPDPVPPRPHTSRSAHKTTEPKAPEPPLTPEEIERRRRDYQEYLRKHGLTPLREVLERIEGTGTPNGASPTKTK